MIIGPRRVALHKISETIIFFPKHLMNKLLLFAAAALASASVLSSCKQDSQSPTGPNLPLSAGGSGGSGGTSTPAHPAVTYRGNVTIKRAGYSTIAVMDSDGTHQTNIVTAASDGNTENLVNPTWNYSGTSIAYSDQGAGLYVTNSNGVILGVNPSYIKAVDVAVNSSGVPVGSNGRTIYSLAASDSATMFARPVWCSTSSTAKIAFVRDYIGSKLGQSELCTISQSGGTPTVLSTVHATFLHSYVWPTWSPDDSKIAAVRWDTTSSTYSHATIMIFDASSGSALDSIPFSARNIGSLEWSRTGANELVFKAFTTTSGPYLIYYCAPTTGSTPTTNSVAGGDGTWSPNNSSVMYIYNNIAPPALLKNIPQTGTTSTVQSSFYGQMLNWKR
jgi:hypothetical protein